MNNNLITIKKAAEMLNVSAQTLRRWDRDGRLVSVRGENNYRYYKKEDIEEYIKNNQKDIFKIAKSWVLSNSGVEPQPGFYCVNASVFQARLNRLKDDLEGIRKLKEIYSLIVAITGEINLQGYITAIGGLDLKILGGLKGGVTEFIFPKENEKDYKTFVDKYKDKHLLDSIKFHSVENIHQVLNLIFEE